MNRLGTEGGDGHLLQGSSMARVQTLPLTSGSKGNPGHEGLAPSTLSPTSRCREGSALESVQVAKFRVSGSRMACRPGTTSWKPGPSPHTCLVLKSPRNQSHSVQKPSSHAHPPNPAAGSSQSRGWEVAHESDPECQCAGMLPTGLGCEQAGEALWEGEAAGTSRGAGGCQQTPRDR